MKKLIQHPGRLAAVLIAIYVVSFTAGIYALSYYPISRQKNALLLYARTVAQEYLAGEDESIHRLKSKTTHILIFNADGECVEYATLSSNTANDFDGYIEPFLTTVLDGNNLFRITKSYFSNHILRFWFVAGVPVETPSATGAVFVIDSMMLLQEALIGYTFYFSLFYWLSAYLLILTARKHKKLDDLQMNYVDNVTHALKTPVASVKALAETLCDGVEADPDRQRVLFGMILQEANLQGYMVRNLLELSKLQSRSSNFQRTSTCASDLFAPVIEKYAVICDCVGANLHISDEITHLPPLYTNAACVKEILGILLDNALKFVDEGGDVWIECCTGKKRATICIRDNGAGISKEALPHVFERFYKGGGKQNDSGSGLGLAIAKEIVDGLQEKIWAESTPGKGAAFYFTVRLK